MSGLDRRGFLKGAALAGAAAVSSQKAWAAGDSAEFKNLPDEQVDVAIVGAGFAGLTAAELLWSAGKSVKVIEARPRMGGRTWTERFGPEGLPLESGGQWIGPGQDYVHRRLRHFNVPTFRTFDQGVNIIETERRRGGEGVFHYYDAEGGLTPGKALRIFKGTALDFSALYEGLDRLAETVSLTAPWETEGAQELDQRTLESWIQEQWSRLGPLRLKPADERVRNIMRSVIHTVFSASPSKISLLHALFYIKSGGGMDSLINVTGGAQQERFLNGTQELLHKMAAPFEKDIVLASPVHAIEQRGGHAVVHSKRVKVRAQRVIVALPPALIPRMEFLPALSARRDLLYQSYPMGNTIKVMALYEKPFWRTGRRNFSGQFFSPFTPLTAAFDNSHPSSSQGALLGFMVGPQADLALAQSPEERRGEALRSFAHFFGQEALRPISYHEKVWAEEGFSRGAYAGYLPPGIWTSYGDLLRKPEGLIHWAGTETSEVWNGYIEGAIRSGYRAAREVLS